ncbi:hypothetical protein E4T56_gene16580 [Termitomyces sp. T112]|nr:hypothetical protein E4T56_gene16580 [Termitomyces sp. T112]
MSSAATITNECMGLESGGVEWPGSGAVDLEYCKLYACYANKPWVVPFTKNFAPLPSLEYKMEDLFGVGMMGASAAKEKSKEVVEDSGEEEEEQEEGTSGSGRERVVTLLAEQCNVANTIARRLAEEIEVEAEGPVTGPSGAHISENPAPEQVPEDSIVEASTGEILKL